MVEINSYEFDTLLIYACRYALNRGTAAPDEVISIIENHVAAKNIGSKTKSILVKSIQSALEFKDVPEHKVEEWSEVLLLLKKHSEAN